ncbi:MAG: capsule assembly Wzi family protein [Gemmatimonadota bacterium]
MGVVVGRVLLVCFAFGALVQAVQAQEVDVGDLHERYLRLLQLSGDAPMRSFSNRPLIERDDLAPEDGDTGPWGLVRPQAIVGCEGCDLVIRPTSTGIRLFNNSHHPVNGLDGAVWQGKGLTTAIDFGASLEWRGLRLSFAPSLIWTQNSSFELAPVEVGGQSVFGYPWRPIDLPQRFGASSFSRLDAGQSEFRVSGFGMTGGFGTRNLWWGPGVRSGILMGNNAGGFPHAFLGTRGPRSIGIGTVEANWIWGSLAQSKYFDLPASSDDRYLTGLVVSFAPSFLHGLHVGFARVFYGWVPPDGVSVGDRFLVFQGIRKERLQSGGNPTGDDERDQIVSLFGRWVLPESGFEVYVEWVRNDHPLDFLDILLEPEHSQGYTLGLQKAVSLAGGRRLALQAELTHLEREATFQVRASPVYYAHHIVLQGYTHRGEVIGAGIGPGGIQQFVGVELYEPWGKAGALLQRRVTDNDAYYDWAADNGRPFDKHDVSIDLGVHGAYFAGDVELSGAFTYTRQLNRYFFGPKVDNFNVRLSLRWMPS